MRENKIAKYLSIALLIAVVATLSLWNGSSKTKEEKISVASSNKYEGGVVLSARNSKVSFRSADAIALPTRSDVFYLLVVGNDYRPGLEGARADSIHLIGINPGERKATMINFPRDTQVAIPGHGTSKINAANHYGGAELTAQTLEQLTGVSISYTLETDFAGFKSLVDELGGLDVTIEKPMHDSNSGTDWDPGVVRMNGADALAYSRDRHSFAIGDLQRSQNQGNLLISALVEMKKSKSSVTSKFEAAYIINKNVKLRGIGVSDVFYLMELASKIDTSNIKNITVPWAGSEKLAPKATDLFNDFKDNAILDTYVQ